MMLLADLLDGMVLLELVMMEKYEIHMRLEW